ncbi:hypothetical protein HanHA300_Chr01g0016501 [Helianthus annuus]|nr:hypothetical protein HanHA300_Chr01g0016501 [Helianthus annuus]
MKYWSLKAVTNVYGNIVANLYIFMVLQNKVPLLSPEALHHLHIFIFVLAVVHVTFSVLTVVFGVTKIRQWKQWEESIAKDNFDASQVLKHKVTQVKDNDFIKNRFLGIGKRSTIRGWLHSFFKQFYGSVTKSDYVALRLGFITTHCKANPKFNFHKYMIRALEDDFKKVVGIRQVISNVLLFFYFRPRQSSSLLKKKLSI